ncbi:MAG: ATP-dependent protease LonB [Eubacteriales bacterium]|nr:ATP-dependent protease LonB [Eubacteriales bacterium]
MDIILLLIQLGISIIMGIYFYTHLRKEQSSKSAVKLDSGKELEKLHKMRQVTLSQPLSEVVRPASMEDIIGQEEGIRALRAALCGPNPQHVIIYGPPGIGKTCAARLILEEAKKSPVSPFASAAKFIEMDATCIRFDERAIADPLIGSVHDPIYQGAGAYGAAGVPQPKAGAVTKANGGMLFLDEIGELHPIQMNKLLKVLEDRKVRFESAYYSEGDKNIPPHIHDIFKSGLPADFRLVGATTRSASELPPALRSRCMEVYFRALTRDELSVIARRAAVKGGVEISAEAAKAVGQYAGNGREAVNLVQMAAGLVCDERRDRIEQYDIEWVASNARLSRQEDPVAQEQAVCGCVNGLAVQGDGQGTMLRIEAYACPTQNGQGILRLTGALEEEELGRDGHRMRRKSAMRASAENVCTVLQRYFGIRFCDYDVHINFPGGMPVDGPSAGIALACAVFSAVSGQVVSPRIALTGELSIAGDVYPVGGVGEKLKAAIQAGIRTVYIPAGNMQETYRSLPVQVVPVRHIAELFGAEAVLQPLPGVSAQQEPVIAAPGTPITQ